MIGRTVERRERPNEFEVALPRSIRQGLFMSERSRKSSQKRICPFDLCQKWVEWGKNRLMPEPAGSYRRHPVATGVLRLIPSS
jgi:hypothetical protein